MYKKLISVIVPCYNQAQYLDECLQSVLDQTYSNWECIIVDDGSPDNTEEVAKKWELKDSRFRYIKKENGGPSSARNVGLDVSTGEWVQFIDGDDTIQKEKFTDSSIFFDDFDAIISDYETFDEKGALPHYCEFIDRDLSYKDILLKWDIEFTIPIHCFIFNRRFVTPFNLSLKAKEDWVFWLSFFHCNPKVVKIDKKYANYRMHNKNMTKNLSHMIRNEQEALRFIFENLEEDLKNEFFISRIKYKNKEIIRLIESNNRLLQSKRYKIGNYIVNAINKLRFIKN